MSESNGPGLISIPDIINKMQRTKYAYPYFSIFKVAYFGKAADTLDYFEAIGLPCAIHFNPADFLRTQTKSSILKQSMIGSHLNLLKLM
jgi:hypothetical protein